MKKLNIIISLVFIILIGSAIFSWHAYINTKKWEKIVYPSIKIEAVNVTEKSFAESNSSLIKGSRVS